MGIYEKKYAKNHVHYNYANDRPPNTDPNYAAICRCWRTDAREKENKGNIIGRDDERVYS